jgi:hypothetical protein
MQVFAVIVLLASTPHAAAQGPSDQGPPSDSSNLDKLFAAGSYSKSPTIEVESRGSGQTFSRQPIHLVYLTLRGLAELPALMLETWGVPYKATYYGKEDFVTKKSSFPNGRVPVLMGFSKDGHLAQSSAIVRALARQAQIGGHDVDGSSGLVDALFETYKELFQSHTRWGKPFQIDSLKSGIKEGKTCKGSLDFKTSNNGGDYTAFEKSCMALRTFEDILEANEKAEPPFMNHLTRGVDPSYADLTIFLTLLELGEESDGIPDWGTALGLPYLQKLETHLIANERIAGYLSSDRRMPRIKKIDGDYVYFKSRFSPEVKEVKEIRGAEL